MRLSLQHKKWYATRKFRYLISKNSIGRARKILWNRCWQKGLLRNHDFCRFFKIYTFSRGAASVSFIKMQKFLFFEDIILQNRTIRFESAIIYKNNGIFWLQFFCGWYIERCSSVERFSTEGESLSASKRGNEARRAIQTEPERTKWV